MVSIRNITFNINNSTTIYTCPVGKRAKTIIRFLEFKASGAIFQLGSLYYEYNGTAYSLIAKPYVSSTVATFPHNCFVLYNNNGGLDRLATPYGYTDILPAEHFIDENESISVSYCRGHIIVVEEDK